MRHQCSRSTPLKLTGTFAQGLAPPVTATGLLQHETKLSVLHFGLRKSTTFTAPLPNKAPLLLVSGIRYVPCTTLMHAVLPCTRELSAVPQPVLGKHSDSLTARYGRSGTGCAQHSALLCHPVGYHGMLLLNQPKRKFHQVLPSQDQHSGCSEAASEHETRAGASKYNSGRLNDCSSSAMLGQVSGHLPAGQQQDAAIGAFKPISVSSDAICRVLI